jgi:hypothetical protein
MCQSSAILLVKLWDIERVVFSFSVRFDLVGWVAVDDALIWLSKYLVLAGGLANGRGDHGSRLDDDTFILFHHATFILYR